MDLKIYNRGMSIIYNSKKAEIFLTTVLLIFFLSPSISAANIEITIPKDVEVKSSWITLGEIAQIEGITGEKLSNLQSVKLDKASRPGYSRMISSQLVKLILKDKGYKTDNFLFNIPERIEVKTSSQKISVDELKEFVSDHIKNNIANSSSILNLNISFAQDEIIIPAAEYSFAVDRKRESYRGNYSVSVDILIDGSSYKRVYLNVKAEVFQRVFVAEKRIFIGDKLRRDDFTYQKKDITDISGVIITEWDNNLIKDSILARTISKGEILTESYLKKPVIIKWGDRVRAEVRVGGITVITEVKARGRGKKGDYISVENLKSGNRFKAKIINRYLVRLVRN